MTIACDVLARLGLLPAHGASRCRLGCCGLLLAQVPPPSRDGCSRARSRTALDHRARGGRAERAGRRSWRGKGSTGGREARSSASFRGRSRRRRRRGSCRCPRWSSRAHRRQRGVCRAEAARDPRRDRPRSSSSWPSAAAQAESPQYALASVCLRAVLERAARSQGGAAAAGVRAS